MTDEKKDLQTRETKTPANPEPAPPRAIYLPAADIVERDAEIALTVDMPGVSEQQIEVQLEDSVLTIKGHALPDGVDGYTLLYRGYEAGDFERSFTLPAEIDQKGIKAHIKHGVLRLILPKSKDVQPRRITVQGAE
jgi:HSP20 family protein